MKNVSHLIVATGLAALLAFNARGQTNTNLVFIPGKLVVYRGGDGILTIANDRQHPAFIDEYDPSIPNQASPILSMELPTNAGTGQCMWFNAHAGSEGQGLTRSADRSVLTMTGYCDDLGSLTGNTTDTPSSTTNASGQGYNRGFGIIDAFTNFNVPYASADWFGLLPGISQCNPRGIATDGSNDFWGCGTIAGSQTGGEIEETGTLFWNSAVSSTPEQVQNEVNSGYFMRIINDVVYMVCQTDTGGAQNNGVYDFAQYAFAGGALVPLPWIPGGVQTVLTTNLFLNFGDTYNSIKTFDMNPSGTIAYAADTVYGIVKFVNSGGTWMSPYIFNSTNIGSGNQPAGGTGCFGIAVDFSGTNPVIYATTMDINGGNTGSNRLISITDTGVVPDPGAVLAVTLATASNINEVFRGVDFTPDLQPLIVSQPAAIDVITNQNATMSVAANSIFPLSYQWQVNGSNVTTNANLSGATSSTLNFINTTTNQDGNYTVIVSNKYGAVTSQVANAFISLVPVPPSITNRVEYVTAYVGNNQTFSVSPQGTPPFAYQWYFGTTQLQNGSKYSGSANSSLTISNLQLTDSGSYSLTISNQAGEISNLLAVLTVEYQPPAIPASEPASVGTLQGQNVTLSVPNVLGTAPLSYQWYQGSLTNPLANNSTYSGVQTSTLTLTDPPVGVANYFVVVTNLGGSATSSPASVTVLVPSSVAYTGQTYVQNFDSLPDPGTVSVNTGTATTTVIPSSGPGAVTYNVSNPFDFAEPIAFGGLGLSNTMAGWFTSDLGNEQIQATTGDNTTGLIVSFGCTNAVNTVNPLYPTNNRALGMLASPATSAGGVSGDVADAIFALRLRNLSGQTLTNFNLSYVSELWRNTSTAQVMTNWYYVDTYGTNTTPTNNWTGGLASLTFPKTSGATVYGTNQPVQTVNMAFVNVPLAVSWPEGGILWIVWEEPTALSKAQGLGIDNLVFSSGSPSLSIQQTNVSGTHSVAISWPQMFTNYNLQYNASSLANQAGWQNVTQTPTAYEGMNTVTLAATGTQQYFRLTSN